MKKRGIDLVNFFLQFSQSLHILYKISLCFQTADMYYLYAVNGLPQNTKPPKNVKPKIDATNKNFDDRTVIQHNFIKENSNIVRTGASSTIKGESLMLKNK